MIWLEEDLLLVLLFSPIVSDGAIIYPLKTQTLTASSSTEAEFITAVTVAKLVYYLWCILKQFGEVQTKLTDI